MDDAGAPAARRGRSRRGRNAARGRPAPSQTVTIDPPTEADAADQENAQPGPANVPSLTLRLHRRRVQWTEETHDNEHDGKKSSKSCCIFHKQRAFGESSSESDDDKSDDSHDHDHDHDHDDASGGSSSSGGQRRRPNTGHVREKLREMERIEMQREIAAAEVAEGS